MAFEPILVYLKSMPNINSLPHYCRTIVIINIRRFPLLFVRSESIQATSAVCTPWHAILVFSISPRFVYQCLQGIAKKNGGHLWYQLVLGAWSRASVHFKATLFYKWLFIVWYTLYLSVTFWYESKSQRHQLFLYSAVQTVIIENVPRTKPKFFWKRNHCHYGYACFLQFYWSFAFRIHKGSVIQCEISYILNTLLQTFSYKT